MPPPFNVDSFAKDSDAKMTVTDPRPREEQPGARSERRLITRPKMAAAITDEGWARDMPGLLKALPLDQLKGMPLDHRAGYLLSWMDGSIDLEMLVEVSTMPRDEVLRIVRDLYEAGIVEFH
ncbi:MAG TPA: hypothetical protein VH044_02225 [Polyangiaceae bacterium]|nr:hypothetical protein [Polyangiaceae bacterium]